MKMKTFNQKYNPDIALPYIDDAKRLAIIDALQVALAEELNAWWQYTCVEKFLRGTGRPDIEKFYHEAAEDELTDHAAWIMERISQLGGTTARVLRPEWWNATAEHKFICPEFNGTNIDITTSLSQNIEAERGAIETYMKLEAMTRDVDVVTNSKVKEILKDEQEHLQELLDFQGDLPAVQAPEITALPQDII